MLLRQTLLINGIATGMTGLLALLGAPWLPAVLGPTPPLVVAAVGAGVVLFAGVLLSQARRDRINPAVAWTIAAVDVTWVFGSLVLVEIGILTTRLQYPSSRAARASTTGTDHAVRARRMSSLLPVA